MILYRTALSAYISHSTGQVLLDTEYLTEKDAKLVHGDHLVHWPASTIIELGELLYEPVEDQV